MLSKKKNIWVRKLQIRKLAHLRKVRRSKKNYARLFSDLRFAKLIPDLPPLLIWHRIIDVIDT
jgi:hypothetical protein